MPQKICLSVDTEHDCPPYLETYRGIEIGIPRLLSLFEQEAIKVTFFCTGDVARRYPKVVRDIVEAGHELGCHGDSHKPFDLMSWEEAQKEIEDSTATLREFYPVSSFRAPNLRFPEEFVPLLKEAGYSLDSSQAKYKKSYWRRNRNNSINRIPVSTTSSVLRLNPLIRFPALRVLKSPTVLFVHPWEFVDFRKEKRMRLDCRFKTGEPALRALQENIHFFKRRGAEFSEMKAFENSMKTDLA